MANDLKQIGLIEDDARLALELMDSDTPWFDDIQDLYRFAVAIAIGHDLKPDRKLLELPAQDFFAKSWRARDDRDDDFQGGERGIDGYGSVVKDMVSTFCPDEASEHGPYRYSQYLAAKGIRYLHDRLINHQDNIDDVLPGARPQEVESE